MNAREEITQHAVRSARRLPETILPYWLARSRDDSDGGYLLRADIRRSWLRRAARRVRSGRPPLPGEKQVVDQARLLWVFSTAHRRGFGGHDEYLQAASRGYDFLIGHFLDQTHGGYVWTTDRTGRPVNPVKHLYGQAFVIFGFVEYARACGDPSPLQHAVALHRAVDEQLHDDVDGGWREHGDADWRAVADDDRRVQVPAAGRKTGNTVLHWMEALTELYVETGDDRVRRSLVEAIDLSLRFLFPADPRRARERCMPDWSTEPGTEHRVSFGHNVEFAWLLIRAETALAREPSWEQLHAYLDHTLRHGFDGRRGGVYFSGPPDEPADRTDKVWWVQFEFVAALVNALRDRADERYERALASTLRFVERHVVDPRDGVPVESVRADGRRLVTRKAGHWKAGYHEVRATVKLVDAFAP